MGADKALLPLGGERFLTLALRNARSVCPAPVIVGEADRYRAYGIVVEDQFRGCGPLGGIHAALSATCSELNLVLSVDLPLMTPEFLQWLVSTAAQGDELVTVPRLHDRLEPTCAVYRRALLPAVEKALKAGDFKVDHVFAAVPTRNISEDAIHSAGFRDGLFRNINTPEDYESLRHDLLEGDATGAGSYRG